MLRQHRLCEQRAAHVALRQKKHAHGARLDAAPLHLLLGSCSGHQMRQRHALSCGVRVQGRWRDTRPAQRVGSCAAVGQAPRGAVARRRRAAAIYAPKNERLARKDGATTTPVTSKWLAASGAPEEARRNSSALGQEPFDASPAEAAARAGKRRLCATRTRVSATRACGVAYTERTAKRQSGTGRLVQPPVAMRRRAWRQKRREARAAVPLALEAARARACASFVESLYVVPCTMYARQKWTKARNGALSQRVARPCLALDLRAVLRSRRERRCRVTNDGKRFVRAARSVCRCACARRMGRASWAHAAERVV
jgi:hypothetical protein